MHVRSLFAALLICLAPSLGWADIGPKATVEKTVNSVIDILKAREHPEVLTARDREAISKAVEFSFDFREMARRSLGRGWRTLSEAQRQHFTQIFRELLERSYGSRLAAFSGQTVSYGEVKKRKHGRVTVETEIIDKKKQIPVKYSLYKSRHGWRIYNIIIEGVSLVGTYRTNFRNTLKKKGFEGLMQNMQDKLAKLKEADK